MARSDHTTLKKEKLTKVPKDDQATVKQPTKPGKPKKKKTKAELIEERGVAAATVFDVIGIGAYFHFKSGKPAPKNGEYFVKDSLGSYLDGRVRYMVGDRRGAGVTLYVLP